MRLSARVMIIGSDDRYGGILNVSPYGLPNVYLERSLLCIKQEELIVKKTILYSVFFCLFSSTALGPNATHIVNPLPSVPGS